MSIKTQLTSSIFRLIIEIMKVSIVAISIASLMLMSCGRQPVRKFDSGLDEYVNRFETIGKMHVMDLEAKFGTIPNDPNDQYKIVGLCTRYEGDPVPHIIIDTAFWNTALDRQREELMFHEMGHCVLNREHRNDVGKDGCPMSIMNWETVSVVCLEKYTQYYYDELFGRE